MATLSYYFAPVIVTAVCPFLFREKLTMKQIICFVMSTAGLVLITGVGDVGKSGTDLQEAAILSYIDPLVAVLVSVLLLNETMTIWQLAGGILILGFTLWNEISPKHEILKEA